jgi:hypothetical protein
MRVEVRGEAYEFDGWRVFRLYALLAMVLLLGAVLYLRTTGSGSSGFTSVPAMIVYLLVTWGLLLSKERPGFLDRFGREDERGQR